jgi:hypothetical protein
MAVGYTLRQLTEGEMAALEKVLTDWLSSGPKSLHLGYPEFCVYDDMCEFRRIFYLTDG